MWIALLVGVVGWVLLAAIVAFALGRTVQVAERRRPKARAPRRATTTFGRVVGLATGQIPMIRPRLVEAVTGAVTIIRPRTD